MENDETQDDEIHKWAMSLSFNLIALVTRMINYEIFTHSITPILINFVRNYAVTLIRMIITNLISS
jgi:hypothetical protein